MYANYGSPDDFAALEAMGVDVKNKIVITRYGRCFRGLKVRFRHSFALGDGISYTGCRQRCTEDSIARRGPVLWT